MPAFYPENNTPLPGDGDLRTQHKILGRLHEIRIDGQGRVVMVSEQGLMLPLHNEGVEEYDTAKRLIKVTFKLHGSIVGTLDMEYNGDGLLSRHYVTFA